MAPVDAAHLTILSLAIGIVAFLYSSVGHAGASGYIAVMTLLGLAPTTVRPTALLLNILVAIIGSLQFARAGYFRWNLFWPFALLSVPAAYLGGYMQLPVAVLRTLIGLVLLFSAARLLSRRGDPPEVSSPPPGTAIGLGGAIGLLSGLTGTGGGIFLTPALLFLRWARIREAAAVSALFILVNSIAGLTGYFVAHRSLPSLGLFLAGAAIIGGAAGSYFGSRRFPARTISLLLAIVLVIAGTKLILTR
ncbi:MAG: sulfite exporter TauE/SafE family protein [Spartobacteria bacterium]